MVGVLVFWAVVTKHHKLDNLKKQKFILSELWRPEAQNQGVDRSMHPLKSLGKNHALSLPNFWQLLAILGVPWLIAAPYQFLLPSSFYFHLLPFLFISVLSPSYKDTSH